MVVNRKLMSLLIRTKDWLREANRNFESRSSFECGEWEYLAAEHLALAVNNVLQAKLLRHGVENTSSDSCAFLLFLCWDNNVPLPAEYAENATRLYEYEIGAKLNVDFVLRIEEFHGLYEVTKKLADEMWDEAYSTLTGESGTDLSIREAWEHAKTLLLWFRRIK